MTLAHLKPLRKSMDKKAKKKIDVLRKRLQKLLPQLAGATQQMDDPEEVANLKQAIQNGEHGMQSFNHALVALVRRKTIAMEEALKYCEDIATFKRQVSGRYSEGDRRAIVG